jgi:hypothetical protein
MTGTPPLSLKMHTKISRLLDMATVSFSPILDNLEVKEHDGYASAILVTWALANEPEDSEVFVEMEEEELEQYTMKISQLENLSDNIMLV